MNNFIMCTDWFSVCLVVALILFLLLSWVAIQMYKTDNDLNRGINDIDSAKIWEEMRVEDWDL